MLRTYTTDRAGQFDVDAAYVERAAVLAARKQLRPAHAASTAGSSSLARRLLPAWDLGVWTHPPSAFPPSCNLRVGSPKPQLDYP
jgi:hypothetical protein